MRRRAWKPYPWTHKGDIYRHSYKRFRARRFGSRAEWESYAGWLKEHARISLGLLPEPARAPLKAEVFGKVRGDGFTCEKVFFESLPGFYVTGNLYRPAGKTRRRVPGVLCPHGHWADGRLHDHDPKGSVPLRSANLARLGMTAFTYDMVGFNDSCQVPHYGFEGDDLWGFSLMALQTWNSLRSLDFLAGLPEVDPGRIGMTGASGGGTQTFAMMAVEPRLAAAAPVTMISFLQQGGCQCENAPLLLLDALNADLARLFAPRPAFVGSATGDWTRNTPREEYPAIRDIYRFYAAAGRVSQHQVDEEHNYNRELREHVYGFFNRWLKGGRSGRPVREWEGWLPPLRDRMVWWGRKAPPKMRREDLKRVWRERAEAALASPLRSPAAARKALGPLLAHVAGITSAGPGEGRPDIPPGIEWGPAGDRLIVGAAEKRQEIPRDIQFFSTYNRPPFAERVNEILGAVKRLGRRVVLDGKGEAGLWCLFAAALSPRVSRVEADVDPRFDPRSDESWRKHLDLPLIRQIGGLAALFAMIGNRPLELRGAGAALRRIAKKYAR